MKIRPLAFDLEIATTAIPEGSQDWDPYRPVGITCAAVAWVEEGELKTSLFYDTPSGELDDPHFAPRFSQERARGLVLHLQERIDHGFTPLTWNGLGFDFRVLAEESGEFAVCRDLALNHIDPMFELFCRKGYPLGLDKAARGMGLEGKLEGIDGARAPHLWAAGDYTTVLAYLSQDVKQTLKLAYEIHRKGMIEWSSRAGRYMYAPLDLLPACEAMRLPIPYTGFMSAPWQRSKFTDWLTEAPPSAAAPSPDVQF